MDIQHDINLLKKLGKLFGNATGGIVESIGNVTDKVIPTDEEKVELNLKMKKIVSDRLSELEQTTRTQLKVKEKLLKVLFQLRSQ